MALVLKMKKLTEPRKIDGYFFSKVFPDVVQRLVLVPLAPPCPIVVQDLADVQLGRGSTLARMLKWTLKFEKYIIYNLCGNFFKRYFQHFDTMWFVEDGRINYGFNFILYFHTFRSTSVRWLCSRYYLG